MPRRRFRTPDQQPRPRSENATPWLVFAAMIICLAVLEATRAGFGHPAGWLDQAAGRGNAVPQFARSSPAHIDRHLVRIVPLERTARGVSIEAAETSDISNTVAKMPSGDSDSAPAVVQDAQPTPAILNTSAMVRSQPARVVSRTAPLRVYVAGDSAAEPLGYEFQRLSAGDGRIAAVVDFKVSSGLANPAYFDWPARLGQAMATRPAPEAVVLFVGGNDHLQMRGPRGIVQPGQPDWVAEYARRAGEMMDIAGRSGAQVYWVGMPVVRDGARNVSVGAINAAVVAAAAERPWVHYLDVAPIFGDVDREYSAYRPDQDGELTKVRQDDGVHLTNTGSNWVAALLYEEIAQDFSVARQ